MAASRHGARHLSADALSGSRGLRLAEDQGEDAGARRRQGRRGFSRPSQTYRRLHPRSTTGAHPQRRPCSSYRSTRDVQPGVVEVFEIRVTACVGWGWSHALIPFVPTSSSRGDRSRGTRSLTILAMALLAAALPVVRALGADPAALLRVERTLLHASGTTI